MGQLFTSGLGIAAAHVRAVFTEEGFQERGLARKPVSTAMKAFSAERCRGRLVFGAQRYLWLSL
jgi:hypothetical protein